MSRFSVAILVRVYLRTGNGVMLVVERMLCPLTVAERRAGQRDALREHILAFGRPGDRRHQPKRGLKSARSEGSDAVVRDETGAPSEAEQEEMYKMMRPHLTVVAWDLVGSGLVLRDDVPAIVHDLFVVCREAMKEWDPDRASLKTYLYECVATAKIDFVKAARRLKRPFSYAHCAIENEAVCEDAAVSPGEGSRLTVSCETIPDGAALEKMVFIWSLHEFLALLDPDELLALDYLLNDYEQQEVARRMCCSLMHFRRHILQSLQMKAELCGFSPHNGEVIALG